MRIFLTGDTHGDFRRIACFCDQVETSKDDVLIILGDVGINYFGDDRDIKNKEFLSSLPITLFCIHGNHERRPYTVEGYQLEKKYEGYVYVQKEYPHILFAKDGEIYNFLDINCIVIGGAYSIDKNYRLKMGYHWFIDEQPSFEIKEYVEEQLEKKDWSIDIVLSHTCPRKYEPIEVFLSNINQNLVDKTTEDWLDSIENRLNYLGWYCGHFHTSKKIDRIKFMFEDFIELS